MQDQSPPTRNLSEIGHLFLSSVRERQTNGAPLPRRQPPGKPALSLPSLPQFEGHIEIPPAPVVAPIPEILAPSEAISFSPDEARHTPSVSAILASHLNGTQGERVKQYARHLASSGERVGLIEIDAAEFRLTRFESNGSAEAEEERAEERNADARMLGDAIEEMNCDLDRWLILMPHPRSAEARALLSKINHWILLSTCDHDGVVGCYRTLKGTHSEHHPKLSLALLDARDPDEADAVYRKLASVCKQFLSAPLDFEPPIRPAVDVAECVALWGSSADAPPSGGHWNVVSAFVSRSAESTPAEPTLPSTAASIQPETSEPMNSNHSLHPTPTAERTATPFTPAPAMRFAGHEDQRAATTSDVIDLPDDAGGSVLTAVLRSESTELIECPITPPMCPDAKLAVTRDRRIVLLAVARQGLGDLRSIGRAYNWLVENYKLICMAAPQLSINPAAAPCLRLLVDHADLTAELLQPMLQSSTVTVQAYRKLRWGGKTGLLLEAA